MGIKINRIKRPKNLVPIPLQNGVKASSTLGQMARIVHEEKLEAQFNSIMNNQNSNFMASFSEGINPPPTPELNILDELIRNPEVEGNMLDIPSSLVHDVAKDGKFHPLNLVEEPKYSPFTPTESHDMTTVADLPDSQKRYNQARANAEETLTAPFQSSPVGDVSQAEQRYNQTKSNAEDYMTNPHREVALTDGINQEHASTHEPIYNAESVPVDSTPIHPTSTDLTVQGGISETAHSPLDISIQPMEMTEEQLLLGHNVPALEHTPVVDNIPDAEMVSDIYDAETAHDPILTSKEKKKIKKRERVDKQNAKRAQSEIDAEYQAEANKINSALSPSQIEEKANNQIKEAEEVMQQSVVNEPIKKPFKSSPIAENEVSKAQQKYNNIRESAEDLITDPKRHEFVKDIATDDIESIVKNNYQGYEKEFGNVKNLSKEQLAYRENKMRDVASDILGVGENKSGAYSHGYDVKAKSINSADDLENIVKLHQGTGTKDAELISEMFDIEKSSSPFSSVGEARKMHKENPEEFKKILDERIAGATKGNLSKDSLIKGLDEASSGSMSVSSDVMDKVNNNVNSKSYKAVIDRKAARAKELSKNIQSGKVDLDEISKATEKIAHLEKDVSPLSKNKQISKSIKKFAKGKWGATAAVVGAGVGIGVIANTVSSAQDERRRKDAELSRLAMNQTQGNKMY